MTEFQQSLLDFIQSAEEAGPGLPTTEEIQAGFRSGRGGRVYASLEGLAAAGLLERIGNGWKLRLPVVQTHFGFEESAKTPLR